MKKEIISFVVAALLLIVNLAAYAQQVSQVHHIGLLDEGSISLRAHLWQALRQRVRELGYVEGQNITFDARGGDGKTDKLADAAAELVRSNVSIILTAGIERLLQPTKQLQRFTWSWQAAPIPLAWD